MFTEVNQASYSPDNQLSITGLTTAGEPSTLKNLHITKALQDLGTERKKWPNAGILSKCIGLIQFALAEASGDLKSNKALVQFQESINALERSMEQEEAPQETAVCLMLAYCYVEELQAGSEQKTSEDYTELIDDLLRQLPVEVITKITSACAQRGERYFTNKLATLGFNFLKQELIIRRQLQLISPDNVETWLQLENTAHNLIKRCDDKGWKNIAQQIALGLEEWKSDIKESEKGTDTLDPRLAELAEFERATKAYLSHNDLKSALSPSEEHTALIKVIYQDHAPMEYYGKILIDSYESTIDIYDELEQGQKGDDMLLEMAAHIQSLHQAHPHDEYFPNALSTCYEALAERRLAQSNLSEAIYFYQSSLTLIELLISMQEDFEEYRNYQLETLKKLIELTKKAGDLTSADQFIHQISELESNTLLN